MRFCILASRRVFRLGLGALRQAGGRNKYPRAQKAITNQRGDKGGDSDCLRTADRSINFDNVPVGRVAAKSWESRQNCNGTRGGSIRHIKPWPRALGLACGLASANNKLEELLRRACAIPGGFRKRAAGDPLISPVTPLRSDRKGSIGPSGSGNAIRENASVNAWHQICSRFTGYACLSAFGRCFLQSCTINPIIPQSAEHPPLISRARGRLFVNASSTLSLHLVRNRREVPGSKGDAIQLMVAACWPN